MRLWGSSLLPSLIFLAVFRFVVATELHLAYNPYGFYLIKAVVVVLYDGISGEVGS